MDETVSPAISVAEANQLRIAELQRKLAARRGRNGYEANCREIQAEIDRLSASGSERADPQPPTKG